MLESIDYSWNFRKCFPLGNIKLRDDSDYYRFQVGDCSEGTFVSLNLTLYKKKKNNNY